MSQHGTDPRSPQAQLDAVTVRDASSGDLTAMAAIYDDAVLTSVATFDAEPCGAELLAAKLSAAGGSNVVLVAVSAGTVLGYAYSGPFRPRAAYAGTKEVSVYLAPQSRGRGVGIALYAALLERLDALPEVHTQVAVVALPNEASEALHRRFGFVRVGVLQEVGFKFGQYVDTAWYQRRPPG